jgi:hypothetical protein
MRRPPNQPASALFFTKRTQFPQPTRSAFIGVLLRLEFGPQAPLIQNPVPIIPPHNSNVINSIYPTARYPKPDARFQSQNLQIFFPHKINNMQPPTSIHPPKCLDRPFIL